VGNGGAHLANRLASAASFVVGRLELRHALRRRPPGVPPRVEAEVPNATATACSSLSWVDGWRTVLCLAAERVLFCTFSHLGFILHARYAWSIGDDASRYSAPDPGILPLHGPLHSRLESVLRTPTGVSGGSSSSMQGLSNLASTATGEEEIGFLPSGSSLARSVLSWVLAPIDDITLGV